MKKLTIQEYEKLGQKLKEVNTEAQNLCVAISEIMPKKVRRRGCEKITHGFSLLKNDLDERVFAEHGDAEDFERLVKVFYGQNEK